MTFQFVKCRRYVRKNEVGELLSLQCRRCGDIIADTVDRPVGYEVNRRGERLKIVRRQLTRGPNYAEIKILFDDGSYHVANGCKRCFKIDLLPAVLDEIHEADWVESPEAYIGRQRKRKAVRVIALRTDQSGIVCAQAYRAIPLDPPAQS